MNKTNTYYFRGHYLTIRELAAHPEARCRKPSIIAERIRSGYTVEDAVMTPRMGKAAAGRRARLNPNTAVVLIPRGETVKRSV